LVLCTIVHAADVQDRDGGVLLMSAMFGLFPFLLKLYADSGYGGPKFQQGLRRICRQINLEIVKRSELGKFVVRFATAYSLRTAAPAMPMCALQQSRCSVSCRPAFATWRSNWRRRPHDRPTTR
jgi:hypothetical protein